MSRLIRTIMLLVLASGPFATGAAQDISRDDMRSLDGQVQEIKSDVLSIASDLSNLEERLLDRFLDMNLSDFDSQHGTHLGQPVLGCRL